MQEGAKRTTACLIRPSRPRILQEPGVQSMEADRARDEHSLESQRALAEGETTNQTVNGIEAVCIVADVIGRPHRQPKNTCRHAALRRDLSGLGYASLKQNRSTS